MSNSVLSHRNFRWLWISSLFTYVSQWIQQASLGWVVYEITGSGSMLGLIFGMRAIPMIGLSPFAGLAADRWNRKKLMQNSQLLTALTAFSFGAALALDVVTTWMLFCFTLIMGATSVMDRPARYTLVFELVPRSIAMKAVGLHSTGFSLTRMIGPGIAGYLIAWFGMAGSFFIQTSLYLIAWVLAMPLALAPNKAPPAEVSALRDLLAGLRYLVADPTTRLLLAAGLIPCFLVVPIWGTLLPIYAKDIFHAGPEGLGVMLALVGTGGIFGGLIAGMLTRFDRQGVVQMVTLLALCASIVGLATSPSFSASLLFCFAGGASEVAFSTCNLTMLQMSAPESLRGRVSSLIPVLPGFISLGSMTSGPLADLTGARIACILLATACAVLMLSLFASSARMRMLKLSDYR
jgi:MFS family permease